MPLIKGMLALSVLRLNMVAILFMKGKYVRFISLIVSEI